VSSSAWDLELLAAELRRNSGDLSLYAGFLLTTLSAALPPEMVTIEREGGLGRLLRRRGEPAVLAVSVVMGEQRFTLRRDRVGAPPVATIGHRSGGVVLRTETLPIADWSRRLAAELGSYAEQNAAAADALARLTLPGAS